jgi:YD repeat-containing protein
VVTYTYDADGRLTATTAYNLAISTDGWATALPTILPVPDLNVGLDRFSYAVYDAAGRVIATIDPTGAVVTTTYDGTGRVIGTRAYSQVLTGDALTAFLANPVLSTLPTSAADRISQRFYDADGQLLATVDGGGDVVRYTYDDAGREIETTAYATPVSGSFASAAALLAALVPCAQDQVTRTYYDGTDAPVAQIDADDYLTTTTHDETTHTTTTTRYATALTAAQLSALNGSENVSALVGLLGPSPANETSTCVYDADGRKLTETAADGTVTQYSYNAAGQLTKTVVTPVIGQGAVRTTSATYDAFGNVLTQTDANGAITTYTYNAFGQRASVTDPVGNTIYSYYDADGRLELTLQSMPSNGVLNAIADVSYYRYDRFGQLTLSHTYNKAVTLDTAGTTSGTTVNPLTIIASQIATLSTSLINYPGGDANEFFGYDGDGRLTADSGSDFIRAYQYDAFGDLAEHEQLSSQTIRL